VDILIVLSCISYYLCAADKGWCVYSA